MSKLPLLYVLLVPLCGVAQDALTPRERDLLERLDRLERRVAELEARALGAAASVAPASVSPASVSPPSVSQAPVSAGSASPAAAELRASTAGAGAQTEQPLATELPGGITLNAGVDGYYAYNFNRPIGQVNAFRAFDVGSSSINLNQASIVVERAVTERRWVGMRLDLQFGQATETLQGSPASEERPQVYRHVFQAYGTARIPVGKGLTVDFGKWASSLGLEGNYTKDQWNYSRSYFFLFLPFYHFGARVTYPVSDRFAAQYWLVNGGNQVEDFNEFRSQAVALTGSPAKNLNANVVYYSGPEQRAWAVMPNPGVPGLQPGYFRGPLPGGIPTGRTHFVDANFTWNVNSRLTLAGEGDYALQRVNPSDRPSVLVGGIAWGQWRFNRWLRAAARHEYVDDRGGLFAARGVVLRETTATLSFDLADGFQMRWEYRRDSANRPVFLTSRPDVLKREQNTALLGLIWWFGGKQGAW